LYIADSHRREMYAVDFDSREGTLGERRLFVRFEAGWGMPDGATVDSRGDVWIAAIGGGRILRFDATGRLVEEYPMPVSQPTSCEFGGDDLRTLFITSARMKLDDEALAAQPLAGSLFAFEPGVAGMPEPRYRRTSSS
jgi:L-arabinonolactonase